MNDKTQTILHMGNLTSLLIHCLRHLCYSFSGGILAPLNLDINKEVRC